MNELEVQEIFAQQLTNKNTSTALMETYYKIIFVTLEKVVKPLANEETWNLLLDNTYSKSRLCVFMAIKEGAAKEVPLSLLEDLVFVYRHFVRITMYLYSHYNTIEDARFKRLYVPECLLQLKAVASEKYTKVKNSVHRTKTATFNPVDMQFIDQLTNVLFLALLGEEMMEEFLQEVNGAFKILKKYQRELVPWS